MVQIRKGLKKTTRGKVSEYTAIGGPYAGAHLWLSDGTTLPLRVAHERGRYERGGGRSTHWRPT